MPDRKTYVLYHAHCADGFGAAWVASLVLGAEGPRYLPVSYGTPPPAMEDGSDLFILDFSYPRPVMTALAERMHTMVIIDHHASARNDLDWLVSTVGAERLVRVVFDTARSGAALTWREFLPEDPMPELVRYIEDRDLWRWQIPESREVSAGLASYPQDFALWTELAKDIHRLKTEGRVALRLIDRRAQEAACDAAVQELGGHAVPTVNATSYVSETCHYMLELFPLAPFAAAYRDEVGRRIWSLRSRADFDCSQVAKQFGGGGHPQASGFEERLSAGAVRIARECARARLQWHVEHDDLHTDGSLAYAAACYAEVAGEQAVLGQAKLPPNYGHPNWPFFSREIKPSDDPCRNLEKAGALIVAEMDRIERKQLASDAAIPPHVETRALAIPHQPAFKMVAAGQFCEKPDGLPCLADQRVLSGEVATCATCAPYVLRAREMLKGGAA